MSKKSDRTEMCRNEGCGAWDGGADSGSHVRVSVLSQAPLCEASAHGPVVLATYFLHVPDYEENSHHTAGNEEGRDLNSGLFNSKVHVPNA